MNTNTAFPSWASGLRAAHLYAQQAKGAAEEAGDTMNALVWGARETRFSDALEAAADLPPSPAHTAPDMWQPFETAPTDGTKVDLWVNGERYSDSWFAKRGVWVYWGLDGFGSMGEVAIDGRITYWMNIPPAPQCDAAQNFGEILPAAIGLLDEARKIQLLAESHCNKRVAACAKSLHRQAEKLVGMLGGAPSLKKKP